MDVELRELSGFTFMGMFRPGTSDALLCPMSTAERGHICGNWCAWFATTTEKIRDSVTGKLYDRMRIICAGSRMCHTVVEPPTPTRPPTEDLAENDVAVRVTALGQPITSKLQLKAFMYRKIEDMSTGDRSLNKQVKQEVNEAIDRMEI